MSIGKPIPDEDGEQLNQKSDTCKNEDVRYAGGNGGLRICAVEFVEGTNNAVASTGKSHNTGRNVRIAFKQALYTRVLELMQRIRPPFRRGAICARPSQTHPSLFPEKREPEVLNHIHEGSAENKLGGEADDTEGNHDHKKKKDYCTDF
jgi:hypothetical protein